MLSGSEASKLPTNQALEDSLNAPLPFRAAKHLPVQSHAAQVTPQQFNRREFRFFAE